MDNVIDVLDVKAFLNNNPLFESLGERDKDTVLTQAWNNVFELVNPSTVLNNDDITPLYDYSVGIKPQSTYSTSQIKAILLGHVQIRSTRALDVLIALVSQKISRLKEGYSFDTYREDKFVVSKVIGTFDNILEAEKKILWIRQRFVDLGMELEYDQEQLLMHKFVPNEELILEIELGGGTTKKLLPYSELILEYFVSEYDMHVDKTPKQFLAVEYALFTASGAATEVPTNPVVVSYRHQDGYNVIKWSGDTSTEWWRLEREVDNSATWDVIAVLPGTENSYIDKDVLEGNNYSYKLTAINEGGESSEVEAPIEKI